MTTIQVVIEKPLLQATDRAARRRRVNRSAFVREALRAHLRRLRLEEMERREREGYERFRDTEFAGWEKVAVWPKD